MSARIVTISDHVDCPTGFGVQHRHLATALACAGFEVHALGLWDPRPLAATPQGFTRYPGGQGPAEHRRAWGTYRRLLRPDLVVSLGDLATFAHLATARRDFAWCHWLPVDAEPYPSRQHELLRRCDRLVLMSRFARQLLAPRLEGRVPLHVVPHAVDLGVFRPLGDPLALRRRWSRRLGAELRPEDFLLVARDTNQWRKQQPLLLDALARMPAEVKLLLHCRPVAHRRARGWHLPRLARELYGVGDRVVFTGRGGRRPGLSPAELAELDNLADLRVAATQGEGFGVITIEAMACGTPSLLTDYTTSRELLLGTDGPRADAPPLDDFGPAGELVRVAAWSVEPRRELLRPLLDPGHLAQRVRALRHDPGRLARYAEAGLRRVRARYSRCNVAAAWTRLLRQVLAEGAG